MSHVLDTPSARKRKPARALGAAVVVLLMALLASVLVTQSGPVDQVLGISTRESMMQSKSIAAPDRLTMSRRNATAEPASDPADPAPLTAVDTHDQGSMSAGPQAVIDQVPTSASRWLDRHGWKVDWRQGPGPGRVAEAQYKTQTIVIWLDSERSATFWAGAFAHELGHAVAYEHFDAQQVNEWNTMRGLSSWRWVPGTANDFAVGEGDFAEAFMHFLLGHEIRSNGGPLTSSQAAWIAANTGFEPQSSAPAG